jgi:hypothetical protein
MTSPKNYTNALRVGAYHLKAKYRTFDADLSHGGERVECSLHEVHVNGDVDVGVTQLGYGADEASALSDAIGALTGKLQRGGAV